MAVIAVMFASVVVSQVYMAAERAKTDETSAGIGAGGEYVELCFEGDTSGKAYVMLDGDKYADITSSEMKIQVGYSSVIEIYNGGGKIKAQIAGYSEGIEIIASKDAESCERGITYICRCVRK